MINVVLILINPPLGLYIHWPFCVSKCPYCDFNSHVKRSIDENDWADALIQEIKFYYEHTKDHNLKTIFFGGGTPSLMAPQTVERIIKNILNLWNISAPDDIEITLEANPNSVEVQKFKDLKSVGVNRVSLGIQALNQKDLDFLGRTHSVKEAITAIETAKNTFNNMSFDLIYARPEQSLDAWEKELSYALTFKTPHLSLYQLTIEQGTPFYKQYHRGEWQIPASEQAHDFYELTKKIMATHDMPAYEVSNHAKKGFECQHNLIYWRYQHFIGAGPGAHGRISSKFLDQNIATQNFKAPKKWFDAVQSKPKLGCENWLDLTKFESFQERLLMGLRLLEPVIIKETDQEFLLISRIADLEKEGLLSAEYNTKNIIVSIKITDRGRIVLNKIIDFIIKK